MKKFLLTSAVALLSTVATFSNVSAAPALIDRSEMPRTVITNDGEVDDMNSVLRALLYSNEMDIAGIILTSSQFHYAGDPSKGIEPYRWTGSDWLYKYIDDYGKVYPNLIKHDPNYPTADYLRSVTKIGNIKNVGEMDEITEGSEFLKNIILDDDPRVLYIETWGGTNTTARALKSIEEEYKNTPQWEEIQEKINRKVFIYIILNQDSSYADYIDKNWKGITVLNDRNHFAHFAYAWRSFKDDIKDTFKAAWNVENLLNKGALMSNYALMEDGRWLPGELENEQRGVNYITRFPEYDKYDFISEGDSPSFFYLLNNGLRSHENPTYGGWGGRFGEFVGSLAVDNVLDYNPKTQRFETAYTMKRWIDDIQNDFAARADWCVANDYSKANHAPVVSIREGNDILAEPGERVTLHAVASDPDGDHITYKWWRYFEADKYQDDKRDKPAVYEVHGTIIDFPWMDAKLTLARDLLPGEVLDSIPLTGANTSEVSFTVPNDANGGDNIHLILEVQDNGKHHLKHYQRVIITVR